MTVLNGIRLWTERLLEAWVMFLISALTVIVVLAVIWRKAGASLVWYDEVGSIMRRKMLRRSTRITPPTLNMLVRGWISFWLTRVR